MPVVLRIKGYKLYFFSNEGDEPMHIHIKKAEADGKMWLEPFVEEEYFYGFTSKEIITEHIDLLKHVWNEYFGE